MCAFVAAELAYLHCFLCSPLADFAHGGCIILSVIDLQIQVNICHTADPAGRQHDHISLLRCIVLALAQRVQMSLVRIMVGLEKVVAAIDGLVSSAQVSFMQ